MLDTLKELAIGLSFIGGLMYGINLCLDGIGKTLMSLSNFLLRKHDFNKEIRDYETTVSE